jgi:hypothetical protein
MIGAGERTRYLKNESEGLRMGYPSHFALWVSMEFALDKDASPGSDEYPDPRKMSEDDFNDCWLSLNKVEKEWGGYLDGAIWEVLTPNQLKFYSAVEDRSFEDEERDEAEYNQECEDFAAKHRIPIERAKQRVTDRAVKNGMAEHDRKHWRSLSPIQKGQEVVRDILYFPFILAMNLLSPGEVRRMYPRLYSVFQGGGNWLMMGLLAFLLLLPPCVMAHPIGSMAQLSLLLIIPVMFVMVKYAPWYTMLSVIPFWIFYAAVSTIEYGTSHPSAAWRAFWIWLWTLYPLLRGIQLNLQWEEDRSDGVNNRPLVKHPHLLALTSAGLLVGTHYALKGKKVTPV